MDESFSKGDTFAGYLIEDIAGRGGFGYVYKAKKTGESVSVALKILHPKYLTDTSIVKRFHREAQLARTLSHPNVVRVIDDGEEEGKHFIVMEWIEGITLSSWLRGCRSISFQEELSQTVADPSPESLLEDGEDTETVSLQAIDADAKEAPTCMISLEEREDLKQTSPEESMESVLQDRIRLAIIILKEGAAVLEVAKGVGLLHRDIKPDNLLLTRGIDQKIHLKVLDFGLAKSLFQEMTKLSVTGKTLGTPVYMSPEQFMDKTLDIRGDLYSLGASVYTFLAGEKPFLGPETKDYMDQVLGVIPRPLTQLNPDVPHELAYVVHRLMEKNPEDRYETPNDLLLDVLRIERGESFQPQAKKLLKKKEAQEVPIERKEREGWKLWHIFLLFTVMLFSSLGILVYLWGSFFPEKGKEKQVLDERVVPLRENPTPLVKERKKPIKNAKTFSPDRVLSQESESPVPKKVEENRLLTPLKKPFETQPLQPLKKDVDKGKAPSISIEPVKVPPTIQTEEKTSQTIKEDPTLTEKEKFENLQSSEAEEELLKEKGIEQKGKREKAWNRLSRRRVQVLTEDKDERNSLESE